MLYNRAKTGAVGYYLFMDLKQPILRRDVLTAAGTVFTTSLFTGRVKGANDRIAVGFIGVGAMGSENLSYAMKVPEAQPVAVCDVYRPHLDRAVEAAQKGGFQVKAVKDFREAIADRSIDAVCISTPDHWHAYMTGEARQQGRRRRSENGPGGAQVQSRGAGWHHAEVRRQFQEGRGTGGRGHRGRYHVLPRVSKRIDGPRGPRRSAGWRPAGRPRLGYVARPGAPGSLQSEPVGRAHPFSDLPLFLGLRRRRHDRLGRTPHRPSPPVFRRGDAQVRGGAG